MGPQEKLGEIDRELESFGKSDATLGAVMRAARERAPSGLAAIDEALTELGIAIPPAARVRTVPPEGAVARPATWEREPRDAPFPEHGSGLVELPEEVLRAEPLPPVLELGDVAPAVATKKASVPRSVIPRAPRASAGPEPESFEDTTDIRDPNSLEGEVLEGGALDGDDLVTGEIALDDAPGAPASAPTRDDRPLANLFDDAPDAEPLAADGSGGLADLFDDADGFRPEAEPGAHEDLSDLLGEDLQSALAADGDAPIDADPLAHDSVAGGWQVEDEPEHTVIFASDEVRARRESSLPVASGSALDAQLDALVGEPLAPAVEPSEMPHSGDFELMIDEDVLVLDDAELEQGETSAAPTEDGSDRPPPSASQPPPKGFFNRILNRK